MKSTLLALCLIGFGAFGSPTRPEAPTSLTLKRRYEHQWLHGQWLTFGHRTRQNRAHVIAINPKNLEIEILDAPTGKTLLQDRLDSKARSPHLLTTLSARGGEFLVALARTDRVVELHSLDSEESFEVPVDSAPTSLALTEIRPGQIYLTVGTPDRVLIFRRQGGSVQMVQAINTPHLRQVQTLRGGKGEVFVQVQAGDGRFHVLQVDPEGRGWRERLALKRTSAKADSRINGSGDFVSAFTQEQFAHLYVDSLNKEIAGIAISPDLGESGWLQGAGRRAWFAALQRQNGSPQLAIYDAYAPQVPIRLNVGEASSITHTGVFSVHGKTYYRYVKDNRVLQLQNPQEVSAISTRDGDRIVDVNTLRSEGVDGQLLIVRLEGPRGVRLQVLEMR